VSCARGELTPDAAFDELYAAYASTVRAWLGFRCAALEADDLFQDVWTVFYRRWLEWDFRPEMETAEARPVLSFLYRTCHLVVKGYDRQRRRAAAESAETGERPDGGRIADETVRSIDLGLCLDLARRRCSQEELDVLLARLSGLSLDETAGALDVSRAMVDHRYRAAVARLREQLSQKSGRIRDGR
jgi:DNA-directed RNA polymerase specialized sigma24 family protein